MADDRATGVPDARSVGTSASDVGPLGDMSPDSLRAHLHRVADWVADYREHIERRPIVPPVQPGEITSRLAPEMPQDAEPMARILGDLDVVVMRGIVHWGHPAFLGYFGSTSNGPALLGELAAAALNVSAMTWKTSPSATELETLVVAWIRDMVALPSSFTGIVYDTASVAILHALAAARDALVSATRRRGIAGRGDVPALRVYASEQAHSSIEKAMVMLGLGEENVVRVPADDSFRLDLGQLEAAMDDDARRGYRAMAVIATVGTTSTASVDPVAEIATLCARRGVWLHVDAAYGGALAILPEGRWAMAGAERADSVVVNPHKWMFVPLDFSVLFTRHPEVLRGLFSLTPEYLRGDAVNGAHTGEASAAIDYMDYGIQLGRRFRALKAWMVFRAFGRSGMISRLREHCRLAALLARWVEDDAHFALAAPQMMGIVCFRAVRPDLSDGEHDGVNREIVERVNSSGDAYLTHTVLRGRVCIRVGIGNVLTEEHHLWHVWSRVREEARRATSRAV